MGGRDRRESEATKETEELLAMLWRELQDPPANQVSLEPRERMVYRAPLASRDWPD